MQQSPDLSLARVVLLVTVTVTVAFGPLVGPLVGPTAAASGVADSTLDTDPAVERSSENLEAEDGGPVANFKVDASGSVVQFDASSSESGETSIQLYRWDFGDGRTGSGIAPRHNYGDEGKFTVTLTVTTQKGRTDTTEKVVDLRREEPERDEVENVTGHPEVRTSVPENEFGSGDETSLSVVLFNDGNVTNGSTADDSLQNTVTTARYVRASVEDDHDAPVSVSTNEQLVTALPDGETASVSFGLTVDGDAEPGTYTLPVNVTYNHTEEVDPETGRSNETTRTQTRNVTLVVTEAARFDVRGVESSTRIGATGTVNVTLENTGHETVSDATVALTSENGDLSVSGTSTGSRFVADSWEPGETRTVSFDVGATGTASQQRYAFTAEVTYENSDGNTRQSDPASLGVVPDAEQTFSVVRTNSSVAVDDEGTLALTLRNDGPVTAGQASVTVESKTSDVAFGDSVSTSQYVGEWAPGETRTVRVNATATADAETRNYTLEATVDYEDRDGDAATSEPLGFGLRPDPERSVEFATGNVTSSLRVGETGTLTGTIENTGTTTARNLVVIYESESENLAPQTRQHSVGALEPGESATFAFDVEVGGATESGPRQVTLRPEYRDADGEKRQGDSFDVHTEVRTDRDVFAVEATNTTVDRGGATVLEVTVTNQKDEELEDVSAKLFADDPVSVDDGDAYVGSLGPGESATLQFEITAGADALRKPYPAEVDFQYTDGDGDTALSDGHDVPVDVTESGDGDESGGLSLVLVGGLVALLVSIPVGYVYYR